MLRLLTVLIISITWNLRVVLKLLKIELYMWNSQRKWEPEKFFSTLYFVKTNQTSLETQLATYLGGTNWQSLNPFPLSMGYTLLNATQEEEDGKKTVNKSQRPLACEKNHSSVYLLAQRAECINIPR